MLCGLGAPGLVWALWLHAWALDALGKPAAFTLTLLLPGLALAWAWPRWPRAQAEAQPGQRPDRLLHWWGAWPGELPKRVRPTAASRNTKDPAIMQAGFTLGLRDRAVAPTCRLQWGDHLCLAMPGVGWGWVSLSQHPEDQALKVLLHSAPVHRHTQAGSAPHRIRPSGPDADAVASSGAWSRAVVRRAREADRAKIPAKDVDRDDFPPTTIMHKDPGAALEPSTAHGPARPERWT